MKWFFYFSITYLLTHLITNLPTYLPTYLLACLLAYSLAYLLITYRLICWLTGLLSLPSFTFNNRHLPYLLIYAVVLLFQLFSPDLMRCASRYEIPAEHGGYFLNCTGRADGLYADDVTNRPDLYFECDDGQLTFLDLCPYGYKFDSDSSQCQPRR